MTQLFRSMKRLVRNQLVNKYEGEFAFWNSRYEDEGGRFNNAHYSKIMLAMAEEPDDSFLDNKVVADFGCGPRGSLVWAESASVRIGIDVLAQRYTESFGDAIRTHNMVYVTSTESTIPMPTAFVDVLYTLNAMDHVDTLRPMASEMLRILRPGGLFIGSFNLNEPATSEEPLTLTEDILQEHLLGSLDTLSYRCANVPDSGNRYAPLYAGDLTERPSGVAVLWVRARKPV